MLATQIATKHKIKICKPKINCVRSERYIQPYCTIFNHTIGNILQHCKLLGSQLYKIKFGSVLRYRPDDGSVELKHVALYISVF